MNLVKRSAKTREFYRILAAELESHFGNGSEFIHINLQGEDEDPEVVNLRFKIMKQEIRRLEKKGKLL